MPDVRRLDRSPWSGQATLPAREPHPGQAIAGVLGRFERLPRRGIAASPPRAAPGESIGPALGLAPETLLGGARCAGVRRAREGIASLWIEAWGRSGCPLAPALGIRPPCVYAAAHCGREAHAHWGRVVAARKS